LVTCILTPFNLAFGDQLDNIEWYMDFNYAIDIFFAIDIFINFNSAMVNSRFEIIEDRKVIAINYLQSWFLIDLFSIIPFDIIFVGGSDESSDSAKVNQIVRITRISKLYKLVKVTRLIRMFKIMKQKKNIEQKYQSLVKNGAAFDRLAFFLLILMLMSHFIGCIWIFVGNSFQDSDIDGDSWIEATGW